MASERLDNNEVHRVRAMGTERDVIALAQLLCPVFLGSLYTPRVGARESRRLHFSCTPERLGLLRSQVSGTCTPVDQTERAEEIWWNYYVASFLPPEAGSPAAPHAASCPAKRAKPERPPSGADRSHAIQTALFQRGEVEQNLDQVAGSCGSG